MEETPEARDTEHLLRELFPDEHDEPVAGVPDRGVEQSGESPRLLDADPAPAAATPDPDDAPFVPSVTAEIPVVAPTVQVDPTPVIDPVPPIQDPVPVDVGGPNRSSGSRRNRVAVGVVTGLAAVVAFGALGYWAGNRDRAPDEQVEDPAGPAADDGEAAASPDATPQGAPDETTPPGDAPGEDPEVAYEAQAVDDDATLEFESDETDALGRPLPVLPDVLVPNTADAERLPGYHPDPVGVPDSGPYTVVHGGRFYLRGTVGSENVRQDLIRRNLLILPLEVLVIEYRIDADEGWYFGDDYPVFLEDDVLFARGSAEVDERFVPLFEIGANLLALDPELAIRVTGHTDSQGNDEFNLELSTRRAEAVRAQYLAFGAREEQVIAEGRGEAEPIADNATEAGRQANRRVDFEFIRLDE